MVTDVGTSLLFPALVGGVALTLFLWPELRRLQKLRRENQKLRRDHEALVREREERSSAIIKQWKPPTPPS